MCIKNRRNSRKFKSIGLFQSLCFAEIFVLRNRLLHLQNRCA